MLLDMVQGDAGLARLRQRVQTQGGGFGFYKPQDARVHYIVAAQQSKVVGLLGFLEKGDYDPDYMELVFCEVHPNHRGEGVSKALVEEFMAVVCARGMPLTVTPYEDDGIARLKPLIQRYATQRGVHVHEQGLAQDIANNPDLW